MVSAETSPSFRVMTGRAAARAPSCQRRAVSVPGSGWVTSVVPVRWAVTAGSGSAESVATSEAILP